MADAEILIEWFAAPNVCRTRGKPDGFMPLYEVNGKQHGNTYGTGYDHDKALRIAEAMAKEEAARYVGDWIVTVREMI